MHPVALGARADHLEIRPFPRVILPYLVVLGQNRRSSHRGRGRSPPPPPPVMDWGRKYTFCSSQKSPGCSHCLPSTSPAATKSRMVWHAGTGSPGCHGNCMVVKTSFVVHCLGQCYRCLAIHGHTPKYRVPPPPNDLQWRSSLLTYDCEFILIWAWPTKNVIEHHKIHNDLGYDRINVSFAIHN